MNEPPDGVAATTVAAAMATAVGAGNKTMTTSMMVVPLPLVEFVLGTVTYLIIIMMTVIGNVLVVLAVCTYRPLNKVQNYFLVSLAASDLMVALFVMPLHVVKFLANGHWVLGVPLCLFFTTADILLCTSSILNLYWAIHDPIGYAQRRSPRFVGFCIAMVWVLSATISVPPLIGWNDWSTEKLRDHCELSSEKAFVVFSAAGSFFLPLLVMIVVYVKIFEAARNRIRTNRDRSALGKMGQYYGGGAGAPENNEVSPRHDDAAGEEEQRKMLVVSATATGAMTTQQQQQQLNAENCTVPAPETNGVVTPGMAGNQHQTASSTSSADTTERRRENKQQKRKKKEKKQKLRKEVVLVTEESTTTALKKRERISVAKEKRAAKTIAVIIFVFVFCWLPFFTTYLVLPFCARCNLHPKVQQAFVWLGYINSSLNPFLYGILNIEFRRAFKKILCPNAFLAHRRRRLSAIPP